MSRIQNITIMEPKPNLQMLLTTDIRDQIPGEIVANIISRPPFVAIPGVINVRDISSYTTVSSQSTVCPGFAYRSGALTDISIEGRASLLRRLGITTIFDLRHPAERMRSPSPIIDGIETVWEPYTYTPPPVDPKDFAHGDEGVSGFVQMYLNIMDVSTPIFQKVFQHIRDDQQKPFLFHCSAGKDRTGVLAALILRLGGSSHEAILHDYVLTRIGVESRRQALTRLLQFHAGYGAQPESVGMLELCNIRASAMAGFLKAIEESFGGAQGYVQNRLRFSQEDVEIMSANLKSPVSNV